MPVPLRHLPSKLAGADEAAQQGVVPGLAPDPAGDDRRMNAQTGGVGRDRLLRAGEPRHAEAPLLFRGQRLLGEPVRFVLDRRGVRSVGVIEDGLVAAFANVKRQVADLVQQGEPEIVQTVMAVLSA